MIKIYDNDITRGGEKIGWFEDNEIYNEDGKKLGYFLDDKIYNRDGDKIAYLRGNYIYTEDGDRKISIDENRKRISGGVLSDIGRVSIRLLLGD